jgi:hypothetical protein
VVGEDYTNDQVRLSLGVENLGGIRPSLDSQGRLRHIAILTASPESGKIAVENPYYDRMEGDILIYTAQGREGDQRLAGRNKRLTEQYAAPIPIYGFMNLGRQSYRFLGLLELLRHYPEKQADRRGTLRKVWIFELRVHAEADVVPVEHASTITNTFLTKSAGLASTELEREVAELEDESHGGPSLDSYQVEAIRSQLILVEPFDFEHLVKDLMGRSGFRDALVTSVSGDGGIDIEAYVEDTNDFFAGTHVQVQVKRWRHAVGSIEINHFRGALSTTAKGIFVTTSHYTRAAILEARHPSKLCVTLIDGPKLASIAVRTGLLTV